MDMYWNMKRYRSEKFSYGQKMGILLGMISGITISL